MRTGGGLWTGVVVTEGAAAHGNRLAMEPTGHSVTTFGDHDGPLLRVMGYPPIPSGCFGTNWLFSMGWRHGSMVRTIVFSHLEAKFLKTENLRGAVRETGPDAMPRLDLRIQFTTLKSMLANSRETIGKRGGGGSR